MYKNILFSSDVSSDSKSSDIEAKDNKELKTEQNVVIHDAKSHKTVTEALIGSRDHVLTN